MVCLSRGRLTAIKLLFTPHIQLAYFQRLFSQHISGDPLAQSILANTSGTDGRAQYRFKISTRSTSGHYQVQMLQYILQETKLSDIICQKEQLMEYSRGAGNWFILVDSWRSSLLFGSLKGILPPRSFSPWYTSIYLGPCREHMDSYVANYLT